MQKYRMYCKQCTDFTVHIVNTEDKEVCETCNTLYEPTLVADIAPEKLKAQRERYTEQRMAQFIRVHEAYMKGEKLSTDSWKYQDEVDVVESDAGLIELERIKREEFIKAKQEAQKLVDMARHVGRNEKCPCDSGLKYKKCCLSKVSQLKTQFSIA